MTFFFLCVPFGRGARSLELSPAMQLVPTTQLAWFLVTVLAPCASCLPHVHRACFIIKTSPAVRHSRQKRRFRSTAPAPTREAGINLGPLQVYRGQFLKSICKFKCRYLENSVSEMPETSLSLFLPPMYAWKSGKVVNSYWNLNT